MVLEKTPLRPSLIRPVLYGGVAPELLVAEVSILFLLVFEIGLHVSTLLLCLVYVLVVHPLGTWCSARDPQIAALYVRSLRGADFYTTSPTLTARVPPVDPALP
jgi:type IV secretory pathway TrbD component